MKEDKENPSLSINKLLRGAIPLHHDQYTDHGDCKNFKILKMVSELFKTKL